MALILQPFLFLYLTPHLILILSLSHLSSSFFIYDIFLSLIFLSVVFWFSSFPFFNSMNSKIDGQTETSDGGDKMLGGKNEVLFMCMCVHCVLKWGINMEQDTICFLYSNLPLSFFFLILVRFSGYFCFCFGKGL